MADFKPRRSPTPDLEAMRELDPSPVDSPTSPQSPILALAASQEKSATGNASSSSSSSPPSSSSSPAYPMLSRLGLSNHTLTTTLHALQKYSIYPFTLFLGLHITNTSLLPLSLSRNGDLHASDTFLLLTRPYYQSPGLEPTLILLPLATHILSGFLLRLHRRRLSLYRHGAESHSDRRTMPWPKLSAQSLLGYALLPLLAGHTFVNRIWPLKVEGGSSGVGLRYVAHGFAKHPVLANIGYAGLVGVATWHLVGGAAKFLRVSPEHVEVASGGGDTRASRRRNRRWWMVNGAAAAVAATWMLGGLGVVGRAGKGLGTSWEVKAWDDIYKTVPIFGEWL